MTQRRPQHRGPHPRDPELFGVDAIPPLRAAVDDLSWLLGRGYAEPSALKIVGDRYSLVARQRAAVSRAACTETARHSRVARRTTAADLEGQPIWVDGFNCVIVMETALSGGVVLRGRDGALRDLSSVHGTYRRVSETPSTIAWLGRALHVRRVGSVTWLLDRPVSNSGRLRSMLEAHSTSEGWSWEVELVDAPDRVLAQSEGVVASADAWILDRVRRWLDLPQLALEMSGQSHWLLDLSRPP